MNKLAPIAAKPNIAAPKGSINLQKANAGLLKLKNPGTSMFKILQEAGFSESTARNPSLNKLSERQCIEEAWKLHPDPSPKRLLTKARKLLERKLDTGLVQDMADVKYTEVARLVDTVERSYSSSDDAGIDKDARGFAQRLKWLAGVAAELNKREADTVEATDRPSQSATVIDAEVVPDA